MWKRLMVRCVWAAMLVCGAAQAVTISRMSPQGAVSQVRQLTVVFSQPVVPLGDLRQEAPFEVRCTGAGSQVPRGRGRWSTDKVWLYDFEDDLGPGVRCEVTSRAGWQPPVEAAGALAKTRFAFQTGGPVVRQVWPSGGQVEEDQHFLVLLNGPADPASVRAHVHCEVEGVGEALPVQWVDGAVRAEVLKARRLKGARAERSALLRCLRPLPSGARLRLVWGPGVAAKGVANAEASAPVSALAQVFEYQVRRAFEAEFVCERERANKPCLPLRPMTVRFSAPVPRAWAAKVHLAQHGGQALAPTFDPDDHAQEVREVNFAPPLPEQAQFTVQLPSGLTDNSGRTLANAASFPLAVATGDMPPLAKFAAAPFGVIELDAEPGQPPLLPLTVRHVEPAMQVRGLDAAIQVKTRALNSDADILAWIAKVARYHEASFTAQELHRPRAEWNETVTETDEDGRSYQYKRVRTIATRELSLLNDVPDTRVLRLPAADAKDPRPFEVVGIPLSGPGYHVVEVASPMLGRALLPKPATMYVRTGVLVSNMGVHLKLGRDNALVWVTSLDKGEPVAGAEVVVNNCLGQALWHGRTNAQGLAPIDMVLTTPRHGCLVNDGLFVTARRTLSSGPYKGRTDLAFVFSDWQKGIEAWRFHLPSASPRYAYERQHVLAHTVLDRSLFRAGETVSMTHFVRQQRMSGLGPLPRAQWPDTLKITHVGTGTEYTQALNWRGDQTASSSWAIPKEAKLGVYQLSLEGPAPPGHDGGEPGRRAWSSGSFRVEAFRTPLVDARLAGPKEVPVAPTSLSLSAQLSYLAGGGVAQTPVSLSAVLRERPLRFPAYEAFSFDPPRQGDDAPGEEDDAPADDADVDVDSQAAGQDRVVADKLKAVTDRQGGATFTVPGLQTRGRATELQAELTFTDPNGEVQTVATTQPIWPSEVVLGIKSDRWAGTGGEAQGLVRFQVLALDTAGQPIRAQAVSVRAQLTQHISTRKRIVGGFYAYDNHADVSDLGQVCAGQTDTRGLLLCEARLNRPGEVELVAQARDHAGRAARSATTVWVTRQGELWFSQDNDDRMDVLPEKTSYEPGETARLQVRMPFRSATALVTVEREGVIDSRVMHLSGQDPVIELPIPKGQRTLDGELRSWAPNVYVSVLALRGRIREVPWYSFFSWGWRAPLSWLKAFWYEGRSYQAPTALVDLSRPAFKLGAAALKVGRAEHALQVQVLPDKPQYTVRQTAKVRVKVSQDGHPVQGAFAFAAVDEALLALSDNSSWQLLDAMLQTRPWGVETSTAQNEIVGRRHYGRKALPAGGGGGHGATRELFDTLLLWRGDVPLDAHGEAELSVPLNDALTSFRLVAVAHAGLSRFGTGHADIRVTQDLQVLSGLPPLVREGDRFEAILTVRNTTRHAMRVRAQLSGQGQAREAGHPDLVLTQADQHIELAADSARELRWTVAVPAGVSSIEWTASAQALGVSQKAGPAGLPADRLRVRQQVQVAVPVRVLQSTLQQVSGSVAIPVAAPADALSDDTAQGRRPRGGVRLGLQASLTGALPGIRRFFEHYPFICLEQKISKAIGLKDPALWASVANQLPSYLDADGLASYFPPMGGEDGRGSDTLTAYVLAAAQEAGVELPAQARDAMLGGLRAFVNGRIQRPAWAPPGRAQSLMRDVRRLAAIEALARYGQAEPRMLDSITLAPNTWPTAAVINWFSILRRLPGVPAHDQRLAEATQVLRSRMSYAGTTLRFSTEEDDFWWWLMDNPDANGARLMLAVMDLPAWQEDLPRIAVGTLGRQRGGAWLTTNANLWGSLALDKFGQRFEHTPVAGVTRASLAGAQVQHDWGSAPANGGTPEAAVRLDLPWPAQPHLPRPPTPGGAAPAPATLAVTHLGAGRPWLTVQALSAIPLQVPLNAGYAVRKTMALVDGGQRRPLQPGQVLPRGSIVRVQLDVDAQADMTWVVVADPVPGGATILGSGLGRDSALATQGETSQGVWPVYVERAFDAWRGYVDFLPKGHHVMSYTVRLNNPGRFLLPPTRVEAMYAPASFGEWPNAAIEVGP